MGHVIIGLLSFSLYLIFQRRWMVDMGKPSFTLRYILALSSLIFAMMGVGMAVAKYMDIVWDSLPGMVLQLGVTVTLLVISQLVLMKFARKVF